MSLRNPIHKNVNSALRTLLSDVYNLGVERAPRGKRTREVLGYSITFDMRYPLVSIPSRNLGYRFAPAEAAWILTGDNRVDLIKNFSRFIWEFSDDGFFYSGAYGPKIVDQLTYVCDVLADDPETRQAVIDIWRPNPRSGRDIPCTLSYQFLIRDGVLHVVQTMRSGDAWLGYPYDAFNATMLTGYVILLLKHRKKRGLPLLDVGTHTMNVGSAHVYETDFAQIKECINDERELFTADPFDPYRSFTDPHDLIAHLWKLAARRFHETTSYWLVAELCGVSKSITANNEENRS